MGKEIRMISGWERRGDYWTNIGSPDIARDQKYRGYLESRKHESLDLSGLKKNDMWLLRHCASWLLRQDGTTDTGFVLWGCEDLPGGGSSKSPVQKVRQGEERKASLAGEQSLLHEAVFLLRGSEVPCHDRKRCCQRTEAGLACGEGIRQGVHGGTAAEESGGSASGNRDRRTVIAEGAYVSDSGKRFGAGSSDLVWGDRPL